jgi:thymidylate kinase
MRVICVEGSHGCGKTKIINELGAMNYHVFDEGFLDMPKFSLPPQSFTMEAIWASRWIERVLTMQEKHGDTVFFADRSPFSVLFYAPNGKIMEQMIMEQMMDLLVNAGIEIITVHISVDKAILWKRIQDRLVREPEREKYGESKYSHMERAVDFYESTSRLWDYTIYNNEDSLEKPIECLQQIANSQ